MPISLRPTSLRRPALRQGFTLVELLVVIVIIAILAAIAIPAINMAREAARRGTCNNNMRQLGTAVIDFETSKQKYPAAIYNGNSQTVFPWVVALLPSLDQQVRFDNLQNALTDNNGQPQDAMAVIASVDGLYLKILNCPSDPNKLFTGPEISYVANMGIPDVDPWANPPVLDFPELGIFHNRSSWATTNNYAVSLDQDGIYDGKSYTVLIAENGNAFAWGPMPDNPDSGGIDETTLYRDWYEVSHGAVFIDRLLNDPPPTVTINFGDCAGNFDPWENKPSEIDCWVGGTIQDRWYMSRPSSFHSQGFNVVFAGGNVQYVAESIDYGVYARMMTTRGNALGNNSVGNGRIDDAEIN